MPKGFCKVSSLSSSYKKKDMLTNSFGFCLLLLCIISPLPAQTISDVTCHVEEYAAKAATAWQFPERVPKLQVVVLRDPSGEQEAHFDLSHGASLISLRYRGKELLFGETAGASVSLFATRHGAESELKGLSPYWSAYSPDQGGSSMGIPAITTGVACKGESSMRAFATMEDRGVDNSFQKKALLGVQEGKISNNFPPGYSTPYSIETNARWVPNPGGEPAYYLALDQTIVNMRPGKSGPMEWYLNVAAPWGFDHSVNYPSQCTDKHPCTSATANALAAGRYDDADLSNGVAIVAPTSFWRTSRAYIRQNAEYVVLLYNAVWAAPRRTFAAVLGRDLNGVGAHRFTWYICAGSWKQAQSFAKQQPSSGKPILPPAPELPPTHPAKRAVTIACQTTEFKPQPNQVDQAVILHDPAGEQTLLLDTTQGGAVVSLKYHGVEHIWGYNGGGLLQMAFHNNMKGGAWAGDYNPTQAGDGTANSPVTGIACNGTLSADILTTMLDFNHNNGFYSKPLIAVWGGRINDMQPLSYSSPYVLETEAKWVPNPAGSPRYYLQLKHRLVHVADETIGKFGFDFAAYEPWEFSESSISPEHCPCPSGKTNYIVGGWYQDKSRQVGLAVAMPSSNFPGNKVGGGFNSDYMWRNRSFHLSSSDSLDGITSKEFVWYVLVGSWRNSLSFARTLR
jgi:hypothetical protein